MNPTNETQTTPDPHFVDIAKGILERHRPAFEALAKGGGTEIPPPSEGRRLRRPWKIVSGGQTGVDRAGLVAAMELGLPTGGWVPCGRLAEDGVVPAMFSTLRECPTGGFRERTRVNVIDSDATLILVDALPLVGGTGYTAEYAAKNGRPCKAFLLSDETAAAQIRDWMLSLEVSVRPGADGPIVLNVAGPRESGAPGIFERAKKTLLEAFAGFRPVEDGADKR